MWSLARTNDSANVSTTVSTGRPDSMHSDGESDTDADQADSSPPTSDADASADRDPLEALADTLRALTPEQRARLDELLGE